MWTENSFLVFVYCKMKPQQTCDFTNTIILSVFEKVIRSTQGLGNEDIAEISEET